MLLLLGCDFVPFNFNFIPSASSFPNRDGELGYEEANSFSLRRLLRWQQITPYHSNSNILEEALYATHLYLNMMRIYMLFQK